MDNANDDVRIFSASMPRRIGCNVTRVMPALVAASGAFDCQSFEDIRPLPALQRGMLNRTGRRDLLRYCLRQAERKLA
jgi:hypothetical protein